MSVDHVPLWTPERRMASRTLVQRLIKFWYVNCRDVLRDSIIPPLFVYADVYH